MASLLRRPGNLARYSRTAMECLPRARPLYYTTQTQQSRLSAYITARRITRRPYSTEGKPPGDQNQNQNQKVPGSEGGPGGPESNGGKNQGPNEPNKPEGPEEGKEGEKIESKLSEEEQQQVDRLIGHLKERVPVSQHQMLDDMRTVLMSEGLPQEVKEFIQEFVRSGRTASLMDYVNLTRFMSRHMKTYTAKLEELERNRGQGYKKGEKSEESGADFSDNQSQQQQHQQKQQKGNKPPNFKTFELRFDPASFLISTLLTYYVYRSFFPGEANKDITWQEFRANFFDKGLVERLTVVNGTRVRVDLHRDAVARVYPDTPASQPYFHYYFSIGSVESFERRLDEAQNELGVPSIERVPVAYIDEVSWLSALVSFGPTLLLIGTFFWMSRRAAGGAGGQSGIFGIGKSRAKRFNHETDIKTKFSDVAGMDEAKVEIMEFVSFLKQPERFEKLGAKIPRGAILSGPPGTGKTLLAKATAGESGVPFFSVSGSEFVEMFVGVGPSRVRDLFANARKNTPCIIFIDEIDAIGKSRAKQGFGGGNDERESTLNQILTEMDGFNTSEQVVVLAGTNRPDVLDKALMRPGRFDRHISIDRPTMDGRKQIFRVHLKKIVTDEDMEYLTGRLAALTPGFAGADIGNCVNEAALVGMFCPALPCPNVYIE